jgi:hypothetical protein
MLTLIILYHSNSRGIADKNIYFSEKLSILRLSHGVAGFNKENLFLQNQNMDVFSDLSNFLRYKEY